MFMNITLYPSVFNKECCVCKKNGGPNNLNKNLVETIHEQKWGHFYFRTCKRDNGGHDILL